MNNVIQSDYFIVRLWMKNRDPKNQIEVEYQNHLGEKRKKNGGEFCCRIIKTNSCFMPFPDTENVLPFPDTENLWLGQNAFIINTFISLSNPHSWCALEAATILNSSHWGHLNYVVLAQQC